MVDFPVGFSQSNETPKSPQVQRVWRWQSGAADSRFEVEEMVLPSYGRLGFCRMLHSD